MRARKLTEVVDASLEQKAGQNGDKLLCDRHATAEKNLHVRKLSRGWRLQNGPNHLKKFSWGERSCG